MTQEQMTQVVMNRATEMLKDAKINSIYQSFKTEDDAKDWIIKSALATLIIPVSERKASWGEERNGRGQTPLFLT